MVQYSSKVASHLVALKSVRRLVENPLEHSVDLEGCVALVPRGQTLMPGPVLACHRLRECASRDSIIGFIHFLRSGKRGERAAAAMIVSL